MAGSELCEVYSASDLPEAQLIQSVLEQEGIQAQVVGDHLQNAVGDLPAMAIAPRVWVRTVDAERAREVIDQHQRSRRAATAPESEWTCAACGETNEPTFDLCWNCQAERGTEGDSPRVQ